jgi:hypothetical protein
MNYIRNLKLAQFSKLFTICQYSLMQNSRISGAIEGICFKLLVLENLKKNQTSGARLSAALSERRCPDRVLGVWTEAPLDFPFSPPPPSRHPARSTLRSLPPPLLTGECHHPTTSSSIELTRRTLLTPLHVATACSLSRRSATPPGKYYPPLSSSSWISLMIVVPHRPRAPSLSLAAHRPAVPLRQPLIRAADHRLSAAVFLTISTPHR